MLCWLYMCWKNNLRKKSQQPVFSIFFMLNSRFHNGRICICVPVCCVDSCCGTYRSHRTATEVIYQPRLHSTAICGQIAAFDTPISSISEAVMMVSSVWDGGAMCSNKAFLNRTAVEKFLPLRSSSFSVDMPASRISSDLTTKNRSSL